VHQATSPGRVPSLSPSRRRTRSCPCRSGSRG
jgi:hypothetical protein